MKTFQISRHSDRLHEYVVKLGHSVELPTFSLAISLKVTAINLPPQACMFVCSKLCNAFFHITSVSTLIYTDESNCT